MSWGNPAMQWGSRDPTPDESPPTLSNVSPTSGSTLAADDPIVFDLLDDVGFVARFVWLVFGGGATEVVFDGDTFTARYSGASTVTAIAGGWRYSLQRSGGWPGSSIEVHVEGVDSGGNRT